MDAIGRCCRDLYVQPFDRQKVIYVCGAVGGVFLVVVVILTITLSAPSSTYAPPVVKGSDALTKAPLIVGFNNLPQNIKLLTKNKVSSFNFTNEWKNNTEFSKCTTCQTDYPKLEKAKVAVQIWTANIDCLAIYKDAVSQTAEQIDIIQRFISLNPNILISASNSSGITANFANSPGRIGSLISVNGGHSIDGRLGVLRMFYQLGVRIMAIASSCNTPWAMHYEESKAPTTDTGLNAFGEKVVLEMNRLGIVIDLSGSSHQTQIEVLNTTKAPVIFSHSAAAGKFKDSLLLNIEDDVLDKLNANGGLVMVTFSPSAFSADGKNTNITHVIDHMNYLKNKIGAEHVGIGGAYDVDATYPTGLEDISTIGGLFDTMYPNWTITELEELAGNNFLKVFKKVEEIRDSLSNTSADETWEAKDDFVNVNQTCYTDFIQRYV